MHELKFRAWDNKNKFRTVRELIELLKKYDENLPVFTSAECSYNPIGKPRVVELEDNGWGGGSVNGRYDEHYYGDDGERFKAIIFELEGNTSENDTGRNK